MELDNLQKKIQEKKAKVGIIGLGYVGLPLAMEFVAAGYKVFGIDVNEEKVDSLNNGKSYIMDIPEKTVRHALNSNFFNATTDFSILAKLDVVCVCVPTPLNENQEPDISYMVYTVEKLEQYMNNPLLILLESTTYPGTTRELFAHSFEKSGKYVDKDYFLCFSPERVDPGNEKFQTRTIPKVIGGLTPASSRLAKDLYSMVLEEVVLVNSPETAEMSKLLENTFRSINIAFVNEMALMCERMGIDVWETIDAAATKPFGFMPFYPGPGVGGHCIPLDPMYLHWKGKQNKFFNKFIEISQEINMNMPYRVVDKIQDALNAKKKPLKNAKIILVGVAYKSNINDVRESPALDVYNILKERGSLLTVLDPFVPSFFDSHGEQVHVIQSETCDFSIYDCTVILTKHNQMSYQNLLDDSHLIVDMCHIYKNSKSDKIHKIGGGR
ncbi:nucleotide sugar dehydrogenase [Listeria booriae]|uniref:nucleotide sugar dehydrogenase n=1 Tax=Listeria booriae TaxID=1552123 RepID=UPI00162928AE|nr:nucleotide sugar dehydrogenase [Listeria booriae]MBC2058002.1 nucleotide sugar dehydrogenase [Listeria booriae]MBC2069378.1 nucleotide sugar dehydrogenase [Listeria booriae]MBC2106574.1 nucleotide sugar dehydrogenase [Listeria booriae]